MPPTPWTRAPTREEQALRDKYDKRFAKRAAYAPWRESLPEAEPEDEEMATEEESEGSSLTSAEKSQHEGEAQERAPQDETMTTVEATEETIPMRQKEHSSKQEIPEETMPTSAGTEEPEGSSPSSAEEPLVISLRPKRRPRHDVRESTKMDVDPRDVDEDPSIDTVEGALASLTTRTSGEPHEEP